MTEELNHYVIKQANMFMLYNKDDVRIGHIYLSHGRKEYRKEFEEIINNAFEVRR